MRSGRSFLDVFLRGSGPSLELLGAFVLGLGVVGLLSSLGYDLLVDEDNLQLTTLRVLIVSGVLTLLAYALYELDLYRHRIILDVDVDESRLAPAHDHIVWLLGPGSLETLIWTLTHHQKQGGAKHLWLLMHPSDAVQRAYNDFMQLHSERSLQVRPHIIELQGLSAAASYEAVQKVLKEVEPKAETGQKSVIIDITSGTKPLSVGLFLAALAADCQVEYVESDRDANGKPIPKTLRVVKVDMAFHPTRVDRA